MLEFLGYAVLLGIIPANLFFSPWLITRARGKMLSSQAKHYPMDFPMVAQMVKSNPYHMHIVLRCGTEDLLMAMDWAEAFARAEDNRYLVNIGIDRGEVVLTVKYQITMD